MAVPSSVINVDVNLSNLSQNATATVSGITNQTVVGVGVIQGPPGPVDTDYTDEQISALFRSSDITYTVGSGGNYSTVNAAITALSRLKPLYKKEGFAASIRLLSGFTMAEQVLVKDIDLSWITIVSDDAEVPVDPAAITTELIDADNVAPIFGGTDNARLPIIATLFAYPDQGDGYAAAPKDGVAVAFGSHVLFKPGAGVKRPRNGLKVLYGSSAVCYVPGLTQGGGGSGGGTVTGVDFSYATARAVMVSFGSKANLARSIIHHSKGDYGIYVIWGSHGDFYQSQVYDTTNGNAITCRDGSFANMRETQVARSRRGYHALHNGRIDARSHTSPTDPAAIWRGDSAKDCTQYGVIASYNSHIDATQVDVSGSVVGVNASGASSISFTDSSVAENCSNLGISATQGSTIDATGASTNGSGTGFAATYGSTISADTSTANNCTVDGYRADETSTIQARNSSANDCLNYGFNSNRSSNINARGSSATGCVIGFIAFEGSRINAQSTFATGASSFGYSVDRGSEIVGGAISGTTNQTVNSLTGKGIISDAALPMAVDSSLVHITGAETITGIKKFAPSTNSTAAWQVTRADGTTNVIYVDTTNTTPKVLIGVGSTPGSTLNVNGPSYFGGGGGVATSFADFAPSTTASASARFRAGVDPTSPNTGEMWFDNTDLKFRNGATTQLIAPKSYVDSSVATKEPTITAGTTGQYYRGDKTFQTLDKTAVGLANVDNTSDANKPISTATQTALDLKQDKTDGWKVISGVGTSLTGTTTETALATLTLPAGAIGPNGVIRLTLNFSCTNNANTKTARARLGGISGAQYLNSPLVSQARLHTPVLIYNQNSQSSQIGGTNAGNQTGYGQSTSVQVTSTVNTAVSQTIVITGELGNVADSIELKSYLFEYHYQA